MATPTHVLVGSTTLPGGTSTVTISGIPQTYKDLRIVATMKAAADSYFYIRLNDSSSNYTVCWLSGSFGSYSSYQNTGWAYTTPTINHPTISTSVPSVQLVDVIDYSVTSHSKSVWASGGAGNLSTGYSTTRWENNSAVTSIRFSGDFNFTAGSTIYIYGIEG